jgi:hypothetical protein
VIQGALLGRDVALGVGVVIDTPSFQPVDCGSKTCIAGQIDGVYPCDGAVCPGLQGACSPPAESPCLVAGGPPFRKTCAYPVASDGTTCSDGDPCNGNERCFTGKCLSDGATLPVGTPCNDGDPCNGLEACRAPVGTDGTPTCVKTSSTLPDGASCSDSCLSLLPLLKVHGFL